MQIPVAELALLEQDALEAAKLAAIDYHGTVPVSVALNPDQGVCSLTFVATFEDKTECIIQLRDKSVDTALVQVARGLLRDIVPDIVPDLMAVEATRTLHAYAMPLIRGSRWEPLIMTSLETDAAVAKQLGVILARCSLHLRSGPVVDFLIKRLDRIIHRLGAGLRDVPKEMVHQLCTQIEGLRNRANNLKNLDLVLCHVDPNPFNIIINEEEPPRIVGLIDWDGATLLPFGMNAFQIRFICVLNRQRVDDQPDHAVVPIALAFWEGLTEHIPQKHRGVVVDAMGVGLILMALFWEGAGNPGATRVKNTIERLDWLEKIFRPLCDISD